MNSEKISVKKICCNCVEEKYLRNEIQSKGKKRKCSYCCEVDRTFTIDQLSDFFEIALKKFYYKTPDEPSDFEYALLKDKESSYDWDREGTPIVDLIEECGEIPREVATDIQQILEWRHSSWSSYEIGEETEFADTSYYDQNEILGEEWQRGWNNFENTLKTEARFFNKEVEKYLKNVFLNVASLKTSTGKGIIINAGPKTKIKEIYRARVFQSDQKLIEALKFPDIHLGTPPVTLTKAGRMNGRGISVFYGSDNPKSALAEVRPPVGSTVAVARFKIIRSIKLLDLSAFESLVTPGSIFDPKHIDEVEKAAFLRSLCKKITTPVMPDDEDLGYLSTQAIADYLSMSDEHEIDGIMYPSIQAGNFSNFVLFQKAALVKRIVLKEGTEVSVELFPLKYEENEDDIIVVEEIPSKDSIVKSKSLLRSFFSEETSGDKRDPTLTVDLGSISVHVVKSIEITTEENPVSRFQFERPDWRDAADI